MTTLLIASVLHLSMLAAADDSYSVAQHDTLESGKPLVVMVGTDWCAPCQTMKRSILPKVREHGILRKVAFANVNADQNAELARELTGGGPVPQLVLFRKNGNGWRRFKLIGAQSVEKVEKFIADGIADDTADQRPSQEYSQLPGSNVKKAS